MQITFVSHTSDKIAKDLIQEANSKALDAIVKSNVKSTMAFSMISALQKALSLPNLPYYINAFDNSHFSGKNQVGGMIAWKNGEFIKRLYRHFTFKRSFASGDDYSMMHEMLTRRLFRIKRSEEEVPDLLLIDGGIGQKTIVLQVMQELEFEIPFICIAKGPNRNARDEVLFTKDKDYIKLERNGIELKLLQLVRDEVHRFAITLNRKKSNKIK